MQLDGSTLKDINLVSNTSRNISSIING